jgi:hypothetical protein
MRWTALLWRVLWTAVFSGRICTVSLSEASGPAIDFRGSGALISELLSLQSANGGFRSTPSYQKEPSIEATANALFLASLYGLIDRINVSACLHFISNLENADGGFAKRPGTDSSVKSTMLAVASLQV